MKNLLIILLVLTSHVLVAQTIRVADNNFNAPTGPNVFPTLQEAIDAASPGDTIQVQPSPNSYGDVSINQKDLTLMGIGFNVDKDIPLTSIAGNITLTNIADNTSDADSTKIIGLQFNILYLAYNTGPAYTLENILVQSCQIAYIYAWGSSYSPIDGLEIRDCYFTNSTYNLYTNRPLDNVLIRNNLFLGPIQFSSTTAGSNIIVNNILYDGIYIVAEGTATIIINNNFMGATGTETAFNTKLKDCLVSNNIFYGSTPSISTGGSTSGNFERNAFTNNLVHSTGDDTMPPTGGGTGNSGSGNIIANPDFVDVQMLNTWSSTYDFTLQGGSQAINAGSDGTDIGITGGSYAITGTNFALKTTAAPVIQILNTSTVINPGVDLPVRIKAKSN